jgi:hypothetical protein
MENAPAKQTSHEKITGVFMQPYSNGNWLFSVGESRTIQVRPSCYIPFHIIPNVFRYTFMVKGLFLDALVDWEPVPFNFAVMKLLYPTNPVAIRHLQSPMRELSEFQKVCSPDVSSLDMKIWLHFKPIKKLHMLTGRWITDEAIIKDVDDYTVLMETHRLELNIELLELLEVNTTVFRAFNAFMQRTRAVGLWVEATVENYESVAPIMHLLSAENETITWSWIRPLLTMETGNAKKKCLLPRDHGLETCQLSPEAIANPFPVWEPLVRTKGADVRAFIAKHKNVVGVFDQPNDFYWTMFTKSLFFHELYQCDDGSYKAIVVFADDGTHGRWFHECKRIARHVLIV